MHLQKEYKRAVREIKKVKENKKHNILHNFIKMFYECIKDFCLRPRVYKKNKPNVYINYIDVYNKYINQKIL